MKQYTYGAVPPRGYIAFLDEVQRGAWGAVSTAKYEAEDAEASRAPVLVFLKLQMTDAMNGLLARMGLASGEEPRRCDVRWDGVQRKVHFHLALKEESDDPAVAASARRCRETLLVGTGTGQTAFGWDEEVDHGRMQLRLATHKPLADDVDRVELRALLAEVRQCTEALAEAIGKGAEAKKSPRSVQVREATAECAQVFTLAHATLDRAYDAAKTDAERERIDGLRQPLARLLAQYPRAERVASAPSVPPQPS